MAKIVVVVDVVVAALVAVAAPIVEANENRLTNGL